MVRGPHRGQPCGELIGRVKPPRIARLGGEQDNLTDRNDAPVMLGSPAQRRLARSHGEAVRALIGHLALIELVPPVLARALEPFPISVRTLDALHLASIVFLRAHGQTVELASFDERRLAAARALHIPIFAP
jgi:hypothetical protein